MKILRILAATAILASAVIGIMTPAQAKCYLHCNPDGYGGTTCHWNCY